MSTGLPRGSLRSSLPQTPTAPPPKMPRACPVDPYVPRYPRPQPPHLRKCHGPAPWIFTFLATPDPNRPTSENATGLPRGSYVPRYPRPQPPRLRKCHGPAPWIARSSLPQTPTAPPPKMPRACPVDLYAPRYSRAQTAPRKPPRRDFPLVTLRPEGERLGSPGRSPRSPGENVYFDCSRYFR